MSRVKMLDAKTHFSRLVKSLETGAEQEVVVARNGTPVVKIVLLHPKKRPRRLGLAEGKHPSMSLEEFNEMDEEIARTFNESE